MEFKIANEVKNEDIEQEEDKIVVEEDDDTSSSNSNNNDEFKKKMKLLIIIVFGGFIVLMLLLGILSIFSSKTRSYDQVEAIMKDAAISYFKDHKKSLPTDKQIVEITDKTLSAKGYMKGLSEYTNDESCSGKVVVEKSNNDYSYIPYLNCGESYLTRNLSDSLKENIVTSGSGLYKNNNGTYSFRGENVKNYVSLDKKTWRIVKIDENDNLLLILESEKYTSNPWDDRYNKEKDYNAGINNYSASRMRDTLNELYNNNEEDETVLSNNDRTKLIKFNQCIGSRSLEDTTKDSSVECQQTLSNQKIGLLTVSDYINASIDSSCTNTINYSCQNYNYLVNEYDWWLSTPVANSTSEVYAVTGSGVIENRLASSYGIIRPVIMLSSNTVISGGKGTKSKPFILK